MTEGFPEWKNQLIISNNIQFCPDDCEYLNMTEQEQNMNKEKPDHVCLKYNTRLKHEIFHPLIMKCKECFENVNEV